MQKTFTKTYGVDGRFRELPDGDYWLAREEHILSYLWQRGAPVPRVNFKDNTNKRLILENVGESLDSIFKRSSRLDSQWNSAPLFFEKLMLSVQALEDIFDLGVLHLDIALRNLVSNETQTDKVFVIDFSHSLIKGSRAQKPIPLVPVDGLHHPLLVQTLVDDWNTFLAFSGQPPLSPPYDLNISKESFISFWSDDLAIQKLSVSRAILCHGIGNLFIEASRCPLLTGTQPDLLKSLGGSLQSQPESEAQHALTLVKREIRALIGTTGCSDSDKTIIPQFSHSHAQVNVFNDSSPEELSPTSRRPSHKTYLTVGTLVLEIAAWLLIAGQIWWINFAIEVSQTHLSDSVLTCVTAGGLICLLALGRSIVVRPDQKITARLQGVLCILGTESVVLLNVPASKINLAWLWIPTLAVAIICTLIYSSLLNILSFKKS